jgi:Tfp pilus assembly protein PilE
MHKHISQKGFSVVEALIIVVILAILGFIGYWVWSQQDKNKDDGTQSQAAQSWQAGGVAVEGKYADANVVQVDDSTWRMYYGTQPEGNSQLGIYSSTSSDGKTWVQDKGVRKANATFPEVIQLPDGRWRMYFQQAQTIKSAISTDGLNFTDESGVRVDALETENLAVENAAAPAVFMKDDGTYVLAYRATVKGSGRYSQNSPNPEVHVLLWATSPDGLTFTKKGIAIDSRNTTLDGQIDGAAFVKMDDDTVNVYFTTYAGVYAYTFDGTSFSKSGELAFAGDAGRDSSGNYNGPPPGDPTLANINGTWFMYYGGGPEDPGIHYATLE